MNKRTSIPLSLFASVFLVLLALVVFARPVHAEGEEPPPPQSTETVATGDAAPEATEVASTPEVVDPPPAGETPVDEPPVDEALPDETILPDVVDALAQTGTVLVDEFGNPIPAGSEAMTEALLDGDPWYVVGGTTYYFKFNGQCGTTPNCTESSTPIQAAIDSLATPGRIPNDRTIHVEAGTYSGNILINATPNLLALAGAGSDANPTLGSVIVGTITIQNMPYGFTLSGFNVQATTDASSAVYFDGNAGTLTLADVTIKNDGSPSRNGLTITNQRGTVSMTGVMANSSTGYGAKIDTTAVSYGSVTITNSSFDRNTGGHGLEIATRSSITLTGISASLNSSGDGAHLESLLGLTVRDSVFYSNSGGAGLGYGLITSGATTGYLSIQNSTFNGNARGGLYIRNNGDVYLNQVEASHTSSASTYGLYIDTCKESSGACTSTGAGNVSLYYLEASHNQNVGVWVLARGSITAYGLDATSNAVGVVFDNRYTYASVSLSSASTGNSSNGSGLDIKSQAVVTLNGVSSSQNTASGSVGARIDTTFGSGWVLIYDSYGANTFSSNAGYGLEILSNGSVLLNNITASLNANTGVHVDVTGGTGYVSVTRGVFDGNTGGGGIHINAKGSIILDSVSASANNAVSGLYGALLGNTAGYGSVSIYSTYTPNNFNNNTSTGLKIDTLGVIAIYNVTASNNSTASSLGAALNNAYAGSGGYVYISNGTFNNNADSGLSVTSFGFITWYGGSAGSNASGGATLVNNNAAGDYSYVSVYNVSVTGNTGSPDGLKIQSRGAVTLTNLSASGNSHKGLVVDNTYSSSYQPVTLLGTNYTPANWLSFDSNSDTGIEVSSDGAIALTNITASTCGGASNVDLNNSTGLGYVSITNAAFLSSVSGKGLNITSHGAIILNTLTVTGNNSNGAILSNSGAANDSAYVAVYYSRFSSNGDTGLSISSHGAVTLYNTDASSNAGGSADGVTIDNTIATANQSVSITAASAALPSSFSGNAGSGITINTKGSITLGNISATVNGGNNVVLANSLGYGLAYLYNLDVSHSSAGKGMDLTFNGDVYILNLTANQNGGGGGASINNSTTVYAYAVTLIGGSFNDNGSTGLNILSKGAVTLYNLDAKNNNSVANSYGLWVDNSSSPINAGISIYNTTAVPLNFSNNSFPGLHLSSKGTILVNNVKASGNNGDNAVINNQSGSGYVSINSATFDSSLTGSSGMGLNVISAGAIYLYNVFSNSNDSTGAMLNNSFSVYKAGVTVTYGGFSYNLGTGLNIISSGYVSLAYFDARGNGNAPGAYGIQVNNTGGGPAYGVSITGLYPRSRIDSNRDTNLRISSAGTVILYYLDATNSASGAGVDVSISGTSGYVSINNLTTGQTPGNIGLNIVAPGGIFLYGVVSSGAGNLGAQLNTNTGSGSVSVSASQFNNNGTGGLNIISSAAGLITLNGVSALNNLGGGSTGIEISNTSGTGSMGVTILNSYGTNTFSGNGAYGLKINTKGPIYLAGVTASSNGAWGAYLNNNSGTTSAYVTIFSSSFNGNLGTGLEVLTKGWVSYAYGTASNNQSGGAIIANNGGSGSVSITGASFNGNTGTGLKLDAAGSVTLNGISASNNTGVLGYGVKLDNTYSTGFVTILASAGVNTFSGNGSAGLQVNSKNAVTLYSVTASRNTNQGIVLINNTGGGAGAISIYTATVNQNGLDGIQVQANGVVTISSVYAMSNGVLTGPASGLNIVTTNGNNATIYYSTFIGNGAHGIYADLVNPLRTLTLYGTRYYGNSHGSGGPFENLRLVNGTRVIYP